MPVGMFSQTTTSAGQCACAAASVENIGIGTTTAATVGTASVAVVVLSTPLRLRTMAKSDAEKTRRITEHPPGRLFDAFESESQLKARPFDLAVSVIFLFRRRT